eukprot:scaffold11896_cov16-Prasinocladus_malaysianus.AAC.1
MHLEIGFPCRHCVSTHNCWNGSRAGRPHGAPVLLGDPGPLWLLDLRGHGAVHLQGGGGPGRHRGNGKGEIIAAPQTME